MAQQIGDKCTRCDGTGRVYDEDEFEYEWTYCPYFDVKAEVACRDGRIVSIDDTRDLRKWDQSDPPAEEDA